MKARKFKGHVLPPHVYVKNKNYLYFIKGDNLCPLPTDPSTTEFYELYLACLKNEITGPSKQTMGELSLAYFASEKYKKLASNTASDYRSKTKWLLERCENIQVKKITRKDIIALREARKEQPATANKTLAVMKVLLEYALDLGWIDFNPAKDVAKVETTTEMRVPWTDEEIAAFHEHADPRCSLILELCLNTGQRLDDVLSMRWSQVTNDPIAGYGIAVDQQKTGAHVFIPFTDRLQEMIQRLNNQIVQRGSDYIVVNTARPNEKLHKTSVQLPMRKVRDKIGVKKTLHDLRHTCAHRLAEEGLSDELIMAITGHGSAEMVRHYCKAAAQRRRAGDAIKAMNKAA